MMKTIEFSEIKKQIESTKNLWLIGERKWTLDANLDLLNA